YRLATIARSRRWTETDREAIIWPRRRTATWGRSGWSEPARDRHDGRQGRATGAMGERFARRRLGDRHRPDPGWVHAPPQRRRGRTGPRGRGGRSHGV